MNLQILDKISTAVEAAVGDSYRRESVRFLGALARKAARDGGATYAGTVSDKEISRRRAANKRARVARRAARR